MRVELRNTNNNFVQTLHINGLLTASINLQGMPYNLFTEPFDLYLQVTVTLLPHIIQSIAQFTTAL